MTQHPIHHGRLIGKRLSPLWRELIRCQLRGQVHIAHLTGFRVGDFQEGSIFADSKIDGGGNLQCVQCARIDFVGSGDGNISKPPLFPFSEVKLVKPLATFDFSAGDAVQVFLELGGEVIIDQVRKSLLKQSGHGKSDPLRNQGGSPSHHVSAVDDDRNDGGIGRRSTNASFFECFHQAGLGVSGRRLGDVCFGRHL